jgi:ribonuclease-3
MINDNLKSIDITRAIYFDYKKIENKYSCTKKSIDKMYSKMQKQVSEKNKVNKQLIIGGIDVMDDSFNFDSCILNEKNTWITKEYITNLFNEYCKIEFIPTEEQLKIFKQATVHDSYAKRQKEYYIDTKISKFIYHKDPKNHLSLIDSKDIEKTIPLQQSTYQRLECIGDGLLRGYLGVYLFGRYQNMNEGLITTIRGKIEDGIKLAELCKILKLNNFAIISRFMELNNNRFTNNSLLEDIFESFVAAIVTSTGDHNLGYLFVESVIKREIHINDLLYKNNNNKDKLLRTFQEKGWNNPDYQQMSKFNNCYTCCVVKREQNKDEIFSIGNGSTKKEAKQNAAKDALSRIGYKEDSDSEVEELD